MISVKLAYLFIYLLIFGQCQKSYKSIGVFERCQHSKWSLFEPPCIWFYNGYANKFVTTSELCDARNNGVTANADMADMAGAL